MITAWRIVRAAHAERVFDGEGARRVGGRWNSRGTAVVYAADSLALAMLEVLVHVRSYEQLEGRVAVSAHFREARVETLAAEDLPTDWQLAPPPPATQRLGDQWVEAGRAPVLKVPSVVVPRAFNYVFNPRHPDFTEVEIGAAEALHVDARLFK